MMQPKEIPGLAAVLQRDIYRHAYAATDHEVGGVLVGHRKAGPPDVVGSIRAEYANETATELTFTQDSWEHIHAVMERDFQEEEIVGWYHTHPGYGLFLSEQDVFIHRNFFGDPGQFALVIDPLAGEEAVFRWAGKRIVEHYRRRCAHAPAPARSRRSAGRGSPAPHFDEMSVTLDQRGALRWGLIEVDPRTSWPTAVSSLYLAVIGFSVGTVVWELLLR